MRLFRALLLAALTPAGACLQGQTPPAAQTHKWGEPFPGVVHDAGSIRGFVAEDKWLSNFFPCRVAAVDGLVYGSAEAVYQAAKFPLAERAPYTRLPADAAKRLAHSKKIDEAAWDARKDQVMRDAVWAKFSQNPGLARLLLATGDKYLEETNWWDDTCWGVCNGQGRNQLGRILMDTRSRLKTGR